MMETPLKKADALATSLEAKADAIIKRAMNEKCIPGVALAIVKDGHVVVKKGYGVKSLNAKRPQVPDENTLFYIASLSKAITAVGLLRLADKDALKLTDKVSQHLPGLPPDWRRIELQYLLAHQSGIPQITQHWPTFNEVLLNERMSHLSFDPGTCSEYNNFNYAVAGKVIESVSGKNYLHFMQNALFGPLDMTRTGFDQPLPNFATGYRRKNLREGADTESEDEPTGLQSGQPPVNCEQITIKQVHPSGDYSIPSGFLQTTVADLLKFYFAIEQQQFLSPASYNALISRVTPQFPGTIGWFEQEPGGIQLVAKNGSGTGQGFSSEFMFVPGKGMAVILLMNQPATDGAAIAKDLLREVCDLPLPKKNAAESMNCLPTKH